jgi:hypothetical protein
MASTSVLDDDTAGGGGGGVGGGGKAETEEEAMMRSFLDARIECTGLREERAEFFSLSGLSLASEHSVEKEGRERATPKRMLLCPFFNNSIYSCSSSPPL